MYDYQSEIKGSYIANIYYDGTAYYFKLRGPSKRYLLLQPEIRINLTNSLPTQVILNPLVMRLRRYLRNSRIEKINQYKFDRIVEIESSRGYKIICEILPRGNLILVDNNNKIISAEKYVEMKDRKILPGEEYLYPPNPPENPLNLDEKDIRNVMDVRKNALKTFLALGLGFKYSVELCNRLNITCDMDISSIDPKVIQEGIRSLFEDILSSNVGYIYYSGENPIAFSPILLRALSKFRHQVLVSFDEAVDTYFNLIKLESKENVEIVNERKRLEKILQHQRNQIDTIKEKIARYRRIVTKLYDNYLVIDRILQAIREAKDFKKLSWDIIRAKLGIAKEKIPELSVIERINDDGTILFNIAGDRILINYRDTINSYAQKLYEKIKKLESKLLSAEEKYRETIKKLEHIDGILEISLEKQNWLIREPRREWYHGFRWFYTTNGLLVVAGKDAQTNITLLKNYAEDYDLIFHADIHGGAVVLLKKGKILAKTQDIMQAAIFAGAYSRAWKYGYSAVDVFMTDISNIKLSPPSGMYLKKGSFLVLKKLKEFKNVPLELAIGINIDIEKPYISAQILSGPPTALKGKANAWVVLAPGKIEKQKIGKEIASFFKDYVINGLKVNISKKLLDILIKFERVLELIPGASEIRERKYI